MAAKKRFYIMFVSRDENGNLSKVPVPLHYAYIFVAAAAIGLFTITGMAGSYSRMLIKTARFNQLRDDHNALQKDYAHLEKQARQKDIQAASLGSLATEISALYGLTTSKLSQASRGKFSTKAASATSAKKPDVAASAGTAPLKDLATASYSDETYFKSLDVFYSLRSTAMNGNAAQLIATPEPIGRISTLGGLDRLTLDDGGPNFPSLWPVMGEISSAFGQREDPILGNGEGEFHTGLDIRADLGTPIHATADGVIVSAQMSSGYGREVVIDHGHGIQTVYGHMSGFAVVAGQSISRGEVIGYVGHSGRSTGNHCHYEVRLHGTPVNPHKYLRVTLAQLGAPGNDGD